MGGIWESISRKGRVDVPMNAMSYFTSSDARQGKYGRRPNVEMPEKTESACDLVNAWSESLWVTLALPAFLHLLGGCCTTVPIRRLLVQLDRARLLLSFYLPCVDLRWGFDVRGHRVRAQWWPGGR